MPSDIKIFFEPILEQANLILERSRNLWGTNSMMDELKLPVVTVSEIVFSYQSISLYVGLGVS